MVFLQMLGMTTISASIIGGIIYLGLKHYFGGYLDRKAANLADKEDIGEITAIVESIKQDNAERIERLKEQLKAGSALRFLAAEKRLEVHQSAYFYATQMNTNAFVIDNAMRKQLQDVWADFWQRNCLYLDEKVRGAFVEAAMAFRQHRELVELNRGGGTEAANAVVENMNKIRNLLDAITAAVALPAIAGEFEYAAPAGQ